MRLTLVNPNTSRATTAAMVEVAVRSAPQVEIVGLTAANGAPVITTPRALRRAARSVVDLAPAIAALAPAGAIVSAFGDPGRERLAARLELPVTGLAEAAMAEAGVDGRRFAVVTTTPRLRARIAAAARGHGHGEAFLGTVVTEGDPRSVMADPHRLVVALEGACRTALSLLGAEALIIGGGPLATAARALRPRFATPIIEPIPAAVTSALRRAGCG